VFFLKIITIIALRLPLLAMTECRVIGAIRLRLADTTAHLFAETGAVFSPEDGTAWDCAIAFERH